MVLKVRFLFEIVYWLYYVKLVFTVFNDTESNDNVHIYIIKNHPWKNTANSKYSDATESMDNCVAF